MPLDPSLQQLAMNVPPETPPSGGFPPGKTPPSNFLNFMNEPRGEQGGAAPRGKQEVFKPSSPNVAKAMKRIFLYMRDGWGTGGDPNMGPSPALMRNLEIMKRGGPMAEAIAAHMLKTFAEHPHENIGLPPPTIEGTTGP